MCWMKTVGVAAALGVATAPAALGAQSAQVPLAGSAVPQFVDPVPNLLDADHLIVDGGTQIVLEMKQYGLLV